VRHLRRSCDLRSLTSSSAHSRASGIFPASLNARAFARAWLSDRRSAADRFPGRALWALRSAADVLRICEWSHGNSVSTGDKSRPSTLRSQRQSVPARLAVSPPGCSRSSIATAGPRGGASAGVADRGQLGAGDAKHRPHGGASCHASAGMPFSASASVYNRLTAHRRRILWARDETTSNPCSPRAREESKDSTLLGHSASHSERPFVPLIGHLTKGGLSASDERSHSYIGLRWPLHGAAAGSRGRPPHVYLPYACAVCPTSLAQGMSMARCRCYHCGNSSTAVETVCDDRMSRQPPEDHSREVRPHGAGSCRSWGRSRAGDSRIRPREDGGSRCSSWQRYWEASSLARVGLNAPASCSLALP
jgi:hypothetical protein